MLDKLKSLLAGKPAEVEDPELQTRVAFAALLVEAACADEHYDEQEKKLIDKALAGQFSLDASGAAALRAEGETAQADALDIQRFTKTVKGLSADEKIGFVESLWRIILSDGERDPFEDALVRRVCGLIYVSDPESALARRRAEAALAGR